ncbi:MAG TPA: acetoacetate--CoA ligase [Pirellulales bacterium]|jgi:acetoacetyl-CoA synthetase|nr:acetoacetate--CoA ligase [Pirellulales bacterium]
MSTPLWQPTTEQVAAANLTAFIRFVNDRHSAGATDYASLYRWSIDRADLFWDAVWEFCEVRASCKGDRAAVDVDRLTGARWFPDAKLNFAENLLRYRDDRQALVAWNESGFQRSMTYAELYDRVARLSQSLKKLGIGRGDRVAGYLPNIPETVIAMLAAASLGAVWSLSSPDFGLQGVLDRFGQIAPKLLFTADGYSYNGRRFDSLDRVEEVCRRIGCIEHVVVVPYLSGERDSRIERLPGGASWADLCDEAPAGPAEFEQLPFDHPLYILYSSGTTGPPKCIVHRAGGILLQHLKEHVLHGDLARDDRLFYFTTCGWMMWNWLASGLAVGCTLLLYDGSPLAPNSHILFDLAERERATVFGASPKFLSAAEKSGLEPRRTHDLSRLRTILSTGSPLNDENFDFVYAKIKPDVRLSSISGGADLCGCFALGNPLLPVYRGELQCRGLGMKVLVYDDEGRSVVGEKGELVCAAPFPSMPLGFWNDPDGGKYRQAYFERFPGVWRHGDYAEITERGGMKIYGRSDAVLNPGGVRIGTAEIYRQVEQLPEVLESVVVAQQWAGDVRVVLFVKLRPGLQLDDSLIARIKEQIRRNTTPRHVPAKILQAADIPRTRSGKLVELAVRDMIHQRPVQNIEALDNPQALECFRDRPELAS